MIVTSQQLQEYYGNYVDTKGKIAREVKNGKLFPLVKGIYETNPNAYAPHLAQFIYGPSYISFDYALYHHGLIPEAVYNTITCATYNKRKIKTYTNKFGAYIYRDVPKSVFNQGVTVVDIGEYSCQIATPEKALCDKLYSITPVRSVSGLKKLLFEDLRIDEDKFDELNKQDILKIAPYYHSTNLYLLEKLISGGR